MRAARNRRWLAAGLLALSMFSCSYGDREDKKEDDKAKRAEVELRWEKRKGVSYG